MRGRFAPSPTGPLHFGSLVAAVGSYLDARTQGAGWLVRMEDVDKPREVPGAASGILATLERYGLEWDGPVLYQSGREAAYEAALKALHEKGLAYPCSCSRREAGGIYNGKCRNGIGAARGAIAWRARVDPQTIEFEDRVQGKLSQQLEIEVGDFILKRSDGLFAYQLAVVVDDGAQQISSIVRGADLIDSTPRQIWLQQALGFPTPAYLHLPVAVDASGQKLSKQSKARAIDGLPEAPQLWNTLKFLGQNPPLALRRASLPEVWAWAKANWSAARIPRTLSQSASPNR